MENYKIVQECVDEYIEMAQVESPDDYLFTKNLANIILRNDRPLPIKYYSKTSFYDSFKYAYKFLGNLNIDYQERLEKYVKDDTIIFEENSGNVSYSTLNDDNEREIYISIEENIGDAFSVVHELMHDINIDMSQTSISRDLLTEALSLLSEMLLEDYLVKNNVKDAKVPNNLNFYYAYLKAIEVAFNLKLIEHTLNDGYINPSIYKELVDYYDASYIVDKIVDDHGLTLDFEQRYIIAAPIACYMYNRIKKDKKNLNELFELNELIITKDFDDLLNYLDLEVEEDDLSISSYQKLENSYKKYIKSR